MALRSLVADQNLAVADFDHDFTFDHAVDLTTIYVHSSVPITEDIEIWYISALGSAYDTLIDMKTLNNESDYVYPAAGEVAFNEGDKIGVRVSNANLTGHVYITVKARHKP